MYQTVHQTDHQTVWWSIWMFDEIKFAICVNSSNIIKTFVSSNFIKLDFLFYFFLEKTVNCDDQLKCFNLPIKLVNLMKFDEQFNTSVRASRDKLSFVHIVQGNCFTDFHILFNFLWRHFFPDEIFHDQTIKNSVKEGVHWKYGSQ